MITLYTTGCPKCLVLESKLKQAGIQYDTVNDPDVIMNSGFNFAPVLVVDGDAMEFSEAVHWVNRQTGGSNAN